MRVRTGANYVNGISDSEDECRQNYPEHLEELNPTSLEKSDEVKSSDESECNNDTGTDIIPPPISVIPGNSVVVFIIFDFGNKRETKKYYLGQVLCTLVGRDKKQTKLDFIRKLNNSSLQENDVSAFHFPNIRDQWSVNAQQIAEKLPEPFKIHRGRFYFMNADIKCCEPLT